MGEKPVALLEDSRAQESLLVQEVEAFLHEQAPAPERSKDVIDYRVLTEVDHLNQHRAADGSHSPWAKEEVRKNLKPAAKEATMPYAVSKAYQEFVPSGAQNEQERRLGTYRWLGKTAIEVAKSGYRYHKHQSALERVDIEVAEARHGDKLAPGELQMFISPKMSRADASYEVAKSEHLGDDDAIRIAWVDADAAGNVRGKFIESILVSDIPLEAWMSLLRDPSNPWGKSIEIADETSAKSIMAAHKDMTLPVGALPEGPVSLVEAVLPHITDSKTRQKVSEHLARFREADQANLEQIAESITERWIDFEVELADSLYDGSATPRVEAFIRQLSFEWSDEFLELLGRHMRPDGTIRMSRKLAAELESARQNTLWVPAAAMVNNEQVLKQMDQKSLQRIVENERKIQMMQRLGYDWEAISRLEAENNKLVAQEAVEVGAGCPGSQRAAFEKNQRTIELANGDKVQIDDQKDKSEERDNWKKKVDLCVVPGCPTRPNKVLVGPCGVCMGRCQKIYDAGGNPSKDKKSDYALAK